MLAALSVIASELAFIHQRVDVIIREAIPTTVSELLEDWEDALGLPDSCSILADTLPERVAAVVTKYTRVGGQSRQFFIDLAATLGYDITIDEYRPFMCGISSVGTDILSEGHHVRFYWKVNVPDAKPLYLHCGQSTLDQHLLDWRQADDLACIFQKLKPAHTHLTIGYEGV